MITAETLAPIFGADEHEGVRALTDEQRELHRLAAVSALKHSNGGRKLAPEAREWVRHWAAVKPLGRVLGTGAPL